MVKYATSFSTDKAIRSPTEILLRQVSQWRDYSLIRVRDQVGIMRLKELYFPRVFFGRASIAKSRLRRAFRNSVCFVLGIGFNTLLDANPCFCVSISSSLRQLWNEANHNLFLRSTRWKVARAKFIYELLNQIEMNILNRNLGRYFFYIPLIIGYDNYALHINSVLNKILIFLFQYNFSSDFALWIPAFTLTESWLEASLSKYLIFRFQRSGKI